MKAYITTFKLKFINSIQYRAAALAGIATQFFFGLVFIMVYLAFYSSNSGTQPMNLEQLITYTWLNQAFFNLIYLYYRDKPLLNMIKDGNIAYELCRPQNLYYKWYAGIIADKISGTLLKFMPIIIVGLILPFPYNLGLPTSLFAFILFIISLIISTFLVTSIVLLFHIITFYTIDEKGILTVLSVIGEVFSGAIIPVPFFPKTLQVISNILPFRYIGDLPFRLYSGNISISSAIPQIGIQILWTIILIIVGSFLTKRMLKKVVVQGG